MIRTGRNAGTRRDGTPGPGPAGRGCRPRSVAGPRHRPAGPPARARIVTSVRQRTATARTLGRPRRPQPPVRPAVPAARPLGPRHAGHTPEMSCHGLAADGPGRPLHEDVLPRPHRDSAGLPAFGPGRPDRRRAPPVPRTTAPRHRPGPSAIGRPTAMTAQADSGGELASAPPRSAQRPHDFPGRGTEAVPREARLDRSAKRGRGSVSHSVRISPAVRGGALS